MSTKSEKLHDFFKPYLGPNTEKLYQERFVEDYFSIIFEKVAAVKVLYRFLLPNDVTNNKLEFWEDSTKFCAELGNLVYSHEGLLSYADINSMQGHWGYPIVQEKPLAKSLFNFATSVLKIHQSQHLLNLSVVLYIGQAYIGALGPRDNQHYSAMPDFFLKLPDVTSLPSGICSDAKTRDLIIKEIGQDAESIFLINI